MKVIVAALIAIGILYAVDREYNDGRYSSVIQQAIAAMVPR
jgi:rhamnogalacturonyl hydrolase YesR